MTHHLHRRALRRAARMRVNLLVVLSVGAGLVLVGALSPGVLRSGPKSDQAEVRPNPGTPGEVGVHALAYLEPLGGVIAVGARPGARIEEIRVKEDDMVKQGDLLAVLEGHAQAEEQLALAEAQKTSADHRRTLQRDKLALERENYDKLKKARLDLAQRSARIGKQRLQDATDLYKKLSATLERDAKAKFDLDQTFFQIELATIKAELDLLELQTAQELQTKQRAQEDRPLADNGPDEDVLNRQITLARTNVAQTEIRAPVAGRVLELPVHAGEVSSGPLLSLADVATMVARAEVYQSDVPRISLGDPAEVKWLNRTSAGKVTAIGRIVGKNELRSLDPRALQDLRVVKVTIRLDDATEAARLVHLQVEVMIQSRQVARN